MLKRQLFLLVEKSTTFWDNPRTSIKYKDDLHVYKIIQTSWNTFKPTYTQAYFLHKYHIYRYKWLVIPILSTHKGYKVY